MKQKQKQNKTRKDLIEKQQINTQYTKARERDFQSRQFNFDCLFSTPMKKKTKQRILINKK